MNFKVTTAPIILELFAEGKKEEYVSKNNFDETIIAYMQIVRVGIASSRLFCANEENYPRLVEEMKQLLFCANPWFDH